MYDKALSLQGITNANLLATVRVQNLEGLIRVLDSVKLLFIGQVVQKETIVRRFSAERADNWMFRYQMFVGI